MRCRASVCWRLIYIHSAGSSCAHSLVHLLAWWICFEQSRVMLNWKQPQKKDEQTRLKRLSVSLEGTKERMQYWELCSWPRGGILDSCVKHGCTSLWVVTRGHILHSLPLLRPPCKCFPLYWQPIDSRFHIINADMFCKVKVWLSFFTSVSLL